MLISDVTTERENFNHYIEKFILEHIKQDSKYLHRKVMSDIEKKLLQTVLSTKEILT